MDAQIGILESQRRQLRELITQLKETAGENDATLEGLRKSDTKIGMAICDLKEFESAKENNHEKKS